jgi:signal transduction histidine kinase
MRKIAAIFILAVLGPSLILAWLAIRSVRDQEIIVERQRVELYQTTADNLAADVNVVMDDFRVYFRTKVDELLGEMEVDELTRNFDAIIRTQWAQAEVGGVVSEGGDLISPSRDSPEPRIQLFCTTYEPFLTNRTALEVYNAAPSMANAILVEKEVWAASEQVDEEPGQLAEGRQEAGANENEKELLYKDKVSAIPSKLRSRYIAGKQGVVQAQEDVRSQKFRNIEPYGQVAQAQSLAPAADQVGRNDWSALVTQRGEFRELIGEETEGAFGRFLQNELRVLLWYRSPKFSEYVFYVDLNLDSIREELSKVVTGFALEETRDVCLALLDEHGAPVAINIPGFTTDWRKPFVASEVGEILPHWEVASYLVNPTALNAAASSFRWTLGLMILVLIVAIGFGSLMIFWDLNREMKLARQKTDFVSNVSHELKTPLTSIRMFSELLGVQAAEAPAEKRVEYAGVINSEATRLSRLINNLLDFSRVERGEAKYEFGELDLGETASEVVDHYRPQLEASGRELRYENGTGEQGGSMVWADRDAISQIILNLISNADKYGGNGDAIEVELTAGEGEAGLVELCVLDRGAGVGRKERERIFEKFYRIDDSLSSGVQGSGLGLTLARQIARAHGGDVTVRERAGGGSCFALVLPWLKKERTESRI